jgi:molybdenum cofactor guanylyltransferase
MNRVPAYILAGGQSSRFGSDKARVVLNGERLIDHVYKLLEPVASCFTVVADRADKYADLGLHTIGDLNPGLGPVAGLQTALNDLPQDQTWLLLCPCDAVVIRPHWLEQLLAARDESSHAVAFHGNHWQPMPALYARSCLPIVENQLENKQHSMQQLLDRLDTRRLPQPNDWPHIWQVNSASELESLTIRDER